MDDNQDIQRHQFELGTIFRKFDSLVRYKGTHHMLRELNLLHNFAFEAAAKSYTSTGLEDTQTNFETKLQELRWVNGYNDVDDNDFVEIYTEWINVVLEIIDEWLLIGIFDYDKENEKLEVNVGRSTEIYVNIETIITDRDPGG